MKTPATQRLDALGIPYEILEFRAADFTAEEAVRELGLVTGQVFKTLLVALDARPGSGPVYGLFVVPGHRELSLKRAAEAAGAKRAELAPAADLQRITGYVKGGCSPVGSRRPLPVWIDASALDHERITVSAGRRGAQLWIAPADLIRAVSGVVAPLL